MSIICEEIFDEISHPSEEEVRDYASRIGIDPDSEPQLLPLAAEGLMKALPAGWKPCYDDNSKSYYYYNNITKKTQWEHPLDDIYRGLVKKARTESQSISFQDKGEDTTYITDDILSLEEPLANLPSKNIEPITLGAKRKELKLSPIKVSPGASPKREFKLFKQKSEEFSLGNKKLSLGFSSFDEDKDGNFEKHPRILDKSELKVAGGGAMFLKSNTRRQIDGATSPTGKGKVESLQELQPRSILREKNAVEHSRSMDFEKLLLFDKSEKDDDDKKSVRFNLDNNTDIGITLSDKSSSSEEEVIARDRIVAEDIINIKVTPHKGRFTVAPVLEPLNKSNALKLIKPNPTDFIKPKLTINKGSDSEEDTKSIEKVAIDTIDEFFDSDNSVSSPPGKIIGKQLKERAVKKITQLKQSIWEEKNEELVEFKSYLETSHKEELDRLLTDENLKLEEKYKTELESLREEMQGRTENAIKENKQKLEENMGQLTAELEYQFKLDEGKLKEHFDVKKEELEKYYEEKLADTEKELADRVEKTKEELIFTHNANVEQLKQNHSIIIEELKREFQLEEQVLRKDHQTQMTELQTKLQSDLDQEKNKSVCDERMYEKLRCEKRLLEDKYRCLKDKYLRLKTDVKSSIEKRQRRSMTTNTTGSETEQSNSNHKERKKKF